MNRFTVLILAAAIIPLSCSRPGLVRQQAADWPNSDYSVPKLLPDSLDADPYFIVYGDQRAGWSVQQTLLRKENWLSWRALLAPWWLARGLVGTVNWYRQVPDWGKRERLLMRDAILNHGRQHNADFVMNSGDLVTTGTHPAHWRGFLQEHKHDAPLVTELPYLPVIGNHEMTTDSLHGWPNYNDIFDYPAFYTVHAPSLDLIVVDSDLILDQYENIDDAVQDAAFRRWFVSEDPEQPAWLEQQLQASTAPFRILAMHHPILSFGKHSVDWQKPAYGNNLYAKLRELVAVLQKYRVQVVIAGHEHFYERNALRLADTAPETALQVIVSGGGGTPLRALATPEKVSSHASHYREQGFAASQLAAFRAFHFCTVEVKPDTLSIRAIGIDPDSGREQVLETLNLPAQP